MPALLINNEIYGDTPFDKQQKIINVINQASKSWVMPTDIQITHYGVGEVENKEFSDAGEYYLDVVSGNVYISDTTMVEEITTPGGDIVGEKTTYIWDLDRTLVSVQDELETIKSGVDKIGTVQVKYYYNTVSNVSANTQTVLTTFDDLEPGVYLFEINFNATSPSNIKELQLNDSTKPLMGIRYNNHFCTIANVSSSSNPFSVKVTTSEAVTVNSDYRYWVARAVRIK